MDPVVLFGMRGDSGEHGCRGHRRNWIESREVAGRLAPAVHWPGALDTQSPYLAADGADPDFDAWLIAWPGGGKVEPHDHGNHVGR